MSLTTATGCEQIGIGTIDTPGNAPVLSSVIVSPDTINIDALSPTDGSYTVTSTLFVRISGALPEKTQVTASVFRPGGASPFLQQGLRDDGVSPDVTSGDSIFTAKLQVQLTRVTAGRYRVQVSALSQSGIQSNMWERSWFIIRTNRAPTLSNLNAPDTVDLPVGGSVIVAMSVAAADSDGLQDIREVFFRSLTTSNPDFKFFLKDDGGLDPPGPLGERSGDAVAGDGIFSTRIPLVDGQAQRRTNIFAFQAVDSFNDTSATLLHSLTVR